MKGEWHQIEEGIYQRPCVGQEHSASFNQNVADGHTELSLAITFDTNIEESKIVERARNAWIASRFLHPEIATELSVDDSMPQLMTYRLMTSQDDINEWLQSTFVAVIPGSDWNEVIAMTYNRRLTTKGKQSMMYVVLSPAPGVPHCFIWNVSHAITDAYSIVSFLNDYMKEVLLAPDNSRAPARYLDTPQVSLQRLPASVIHQYNQQFQSSEAEKSQSIANARAQVSLYTEKLPYSIAMYPEHDFHTRSHRTHCFHKEFSLVESNAIFSSLKRQDLSITFLGAAATIMAVREMYGRGHEAGALLGMTRNARRWINTNESGKSPIPMATDVVFLWIPFEGIFNEKNSREDQLLFLGRVIRSQLAPHLTSVHYISSMQLMCDEYVSNLKVARDKANASSEPLGTEPITPSPPGFSPQGVLEVSKRVEANGHYIERHLFKHTGRQVNASPWIGLLSVDRELQLSLGFDEKYFKVEDMERFIAITREHLISVARAQNDPARKEAKL